MNCSLTISRKLHCQSNSVNSGGLIEQIHFCYRAQDHPLCHPILGLWNSMCLKGMLLNSKRWKIRHIGYRRSLNGTILLLIQSAVCDTGRLCRFRNLRRKPTGHCNEGKFGVFDYVKSISHTWEFEMCAVCSWNIFTRVRSIFLGREEEGREEEWSDRPNDIDLIHSNASFAS